VYEFINHIFYDTTILLHDARN